MNKIVSTAIMYLNNGYSVIPVGVDKNPLVGSWAEYMFSPMDLEKAVSLFKSAPGIALLMGGQNNLTAIDLDLKYDTTNTLLKQISEEIGSDLMSKMCINKTQNGGYHFIFKCSKIENNQKLASRPSNKEEKLQTLKGSLEKEDDIDRALQTALNDSCRVLIETRGSGGYVLIPPTPGYEYVTGKIQEITPEEYDFILDSCRKFNTFLRPVKNYNMVKHVKRNPNAFAEFNKNCDVLQLLEDYGWSQVGKSGGLIKIKRPGKVSSKYSGYYNPEKNIFWVFTTSTGLQEGKVYTPVDLLLYFKYDDDSSRLGELYDEISAIG